MFKPEKTEKKPKKIKEPKKIRLFIALKLDSESEKKVLDFIEKLKKDYEGNFHSKEKLHLTLVFLGWVEKDKLSKVKEILEKMLKDFSAFSLQGELLELCRRGGARNHLWLRFQKDLNLKLLKSFQAELDKRLWREKFELEKRRFLPHLTLGRQLKTRAQIKEKQKISLKFNEIILYRSILLKTGSRYKKIISFKD
ncbi:RNA 2',3'-cyclic phosphodiesterase [Patescibacteria group bacterium]